MTVNPEMLKALPQFRRMAFSNLRQLAEALRELAELAEACADPELATVDLFGRSDVKELDLNFEPEAIGAIDELIEGIDARWELLDAASDEVSTLFRATAQSLDVLKQLMIEGVPAVPGEEECGDDCDCGCDCDDEECDCECDCDDDDCDGHHHH